MVGVPGRSKGCNTCIQRRIKCDQGTPYCGNCAKSRRICGGYTRKLGIVFSSDVRFEDGQVQALNQDKSSIACQGRWKGNKKGPGRSSGVIMAAQAPYTWTDAASDSSSSPPPIRDLASNSVVWEQWRHIFTDMYMPQDEHSRSTSQTDVTGNWIMQLRSQPIESRVLEFAVAACALSHIGHDRNNDAMVSRARDLYVASLERMRGALSASKSRQSDETLAACMALSMYELYSNVSDDSCQYDAHLKGALALMEMRGPDTINTPLAHSLFLGLRRQSILGSLAHHQETFLSSSPWRERPWATFPKNSVDSCLDALYSLPAVLRIWDEVLEATDPDEVRKGCLSAIREVSKVDIMLSGWLDGFQQTVSGATYTPTFSTLTSAVDEDGAKLFPLSFQFSAFTICYQMTTYWSGMMVVNEMMMLAYRKLAELDPSSGAGALAREHEETWVSMIRNICQSTECFEKPENGKVGLAVGVSMLRGCQLTLKDYPENWHLERAWLEESMWRIHKKLTIAVSRFVREG